MDQQNRRFNEETEGKLVTCANTHPRLVVLRKQRSLIDSLTTDNKHLSRELSLHQEAPRSVDNRLAIEEVQAALEEIRLISAQIMKEETLRERLNDSVSTLRKRIARGGSVQALGNHRDSQIQGLEARLHNSIIKFNELVSSNTQLRCEVDTLRQEKSGFTALQKGVLMDIERCRVHCSELVDSTTSSYAARDKAIAELHHLRTIADREHLDFERVLRDLNELLAKDIELYREISKQPFEEANETPTESIEEPAVSKQQELATKHLAQLRDSLKVLESMFERIKEATGTASVDEFLSKFLDMESANYSLYTRLDFLASESEKLRIKLTHSKRELAALESSVQSISNGMNSVVPLSSIETIERRTANHQQKFNRVSELIHSIYSRLVEPRPSEQSARTRFTGLLDINEDSVLVWLARIDAMLDTYISSRQLVRRSPPRRNTSLVNLLALPSSIRLDDSENQLSVPRSGKGSKSRANSAASTRPSTNHQKSRKSILAQLNSH